MSIQDVFAHFNELWFLLFGGCVAFCLQVRLFYACRTTKLKDQLSNNIQINLFAWVLNITFELNNVITIMWNYNEKEKPGRHLSKDL